MRWGILSTALIAREHVIPALHGAQLCTLHAIASRTVASAELAAEHYAIPVAHGSYEALLADPDIDAVYIPLPNHLHARWIRRAAGAGKHVLCEKPLTLTARQAEGVMAHAEEHGVLVMEAFMYRFHPAWQLARKLLAAGAVGEVTGVDIRFGFRAGDPTTTGWWPDSAVARCTTSGATPSTRVARSSATSRDGWSPQCISTPTTAST